MDENPYKSAETQDWSTRVGQTLAIVATVVTSPFLVLILCGLMSLAILRQLASMNRNRLQFGLGSLLWLILVAAILIGWYRDRSQLIRERQEQVRAARKEAEAIRIQLQREQQRPRSARVYRFMSEFSAPVSD